MSSPLTCHEYLIHTRTALAEMFELRYSCDLFPSHTEPEQFHSAAYNRAATRDFTIKLVEHAAIKEPRLRSNRKQKNRRHTENYLLQHVFDCLK